MTLGPEHVERSMNWKTETAIRRGSWPFVGRLCQAISWAADRTEIRCSHLVGHPPRAKHIQKHKGAVYEW